MRRRTARCGSSEHSVRFVWVVVQLVGRLEKWMWALLRALWISPVHRNRACLPTCFETMRMRNSPKRLCHETLIGLELPSRELAQGRRRMGISACCVRFNRFRRLKLAVRAWHRIRWRLIACFMRVYVRVSSCASWVHRAHL